MIIDDVDQKFLTITTGGFQQFFKISSSKKNKMARKKIILHNSPSVYKLHISLTHEAYRTHRRNLTNIVFGYLDKLTIESFKITRPEEILSDIIRFRELFEKTQQYEQFLKYGVELDYNWKEIYLYQIKQYFNLKTEPTLKDISHIMTALQDEDKASQRFIDGDQFTLYIPRLFDPLSLLELCQQVDNYLTKNNATAGKVTDVELPIGNYLNFRQEFLIEDYKKNTLTTCNSVKKQKSEDKNRVSAIVSYKQNKTEQSRRHAIVIEQLESSLYQFLSSYFLSQYGFPPALRVKNEEQNNESNKIKETGSLIKNSFFFHPKESGSVTQDLSLIKKDSQKNSCILI